jgi:3',5'-cyclic AMP phosphodiesterase CpdA
MAAVLATALPAWAAAPTSSRRMRLHVLSDTHISDVFPVTMQKARSSLADLSVVAPNADALVVVGDITEYGHQQDYGLFDLMLQTSPHPDRVLYAMGNHEYMSGVAEADAARVQRFLDFAKVDNVYHATEVNGYPMVFLASITGGFNATLGTAQLDWLEATLKACARPDRPTLLFCHQPIYNVVEAARLRQILQATPNVIYVWGHWHTDLNWFTQGPDTRLLSNQEGYWQVQAPATTYCWQYAHQPDGRVTQTFQADTRQGLVIDVYDDGVLVRGRDFSRHEWVPGFQATIPVSATHP